MYGAGASELKRAAMTMAGITLVLRKPITGIVIVELAHHPISGDLGQNARGGDRQTDLLTSHDCAGTSATDEIPLAVEEHAVNLATKTIKSALSRQALGRRHTQLIALVVAYVADRTGNAPLDDAIKDLFSFRFGQHLGIADLIDPPILGHDNSANAQRPSPRAASHFVHANNNVETAVPELTFESKPRRRLLQRSSKLADSHSIIPS